MIAVLLALVGITAGAGSARPAFNPNGQRSSAVEGIRFNGVIANFEDTVTNANYKVSIEWGDGEISDGSTTETSKFHYDVSGSHTYAEEGTYELFVHITGNSPGAGSGETKPTMTVVDAPLTAKINVPAVTEGGALNATIGSFTDQDTGDGTGDYKVTIDWGDGTSAGKLTKTGPGAFSIQGSHTYAEEGARTVSVKVSDAGGSTASASQAITVGDAPLTAGAALSRRGTEGASLPTSVAAFTDANPAATIADFSAAVNWGDRTTSAGAITANPGGGFQVSGPHTYAEEGTFTITIVVTDRGGATVTTHGTAVIADAPLRAYGMAPRTLAKVPFRGVVATFTDAKYRVTPLKPEFEYRATINWGDGKTSAGTFSTMLVAGARRFAVSGMHAYKSTGRKRVTVMIRDRGGSVAQASWPLQYSAQ